MQSEILSLEQKFTRTEAAAYLGVSTATLAQDVVTCRHKIPFHKIGRRVVYPKAMLDQWLRARTVNVPAESLSV